MIRARTINEVKEFQQNKLKQRDLPAAIVPVLFKNNNLL